MRLEDVKKEGDVNQSKSGYLIPLDELFKWEDMEQILARKILRSVPTEELAEYLLRRGAERAEADE